MDRMYQVAEIMSFVDDDCYYYLSLILVGLFEDDDV
jgi:hypothetical protein